MSISEILIDWYAVNKRDLPWRRTKDPYKIWVSEIIFQQTRIDQGIAYYKRIIQKFRNIRELANAGEEDVLKLWQGLGYYSRARNMHAAARDIVSRYQGKFPGTYDEILTLKGIGEYTAAAIASIAFGLPNPVVDGNVLRFFARYFGIKGPINSSTTKKEIYQKALQSIDPAQPGAFNQAIMEFGALQCKPGKPDCGVCPLNKDCYAFQTGQVDIFPVKSKGQKQRKRYFHYFVFNVVIKGERFIYLRKRESDDIWRNLYDFPLIEKDGPMSVERLMLTDEWRRMKGRNKFHLENRSGLYKHVLSHQIILARFYFIDFSGKPNLPYKLVSLTDIPKYPVPRLIDRVLKNGYTEIQKVNTKFHRENNK